ncbi:hypothetical protein [uncultured Pseudokineococcus sp.]|uniref:hypothetical protein n=1 Tax=uncultured Pseudokineococcus sp. TaxID=1642928 RepID=UPI00262D8649|nr:hypothetical protein [uncultured Pseudokineococcus sp.]
MSHHPHDEQPDEQSDVRPDPDAEPSAAVTPGASADPPPEASDPGARPVDEDAPGITQHVGQDESTQRADDGEDAYEEARSRAEASGATSLSVTTRREGDEGGVPGAR